jgi:8-oxo-dGTP diphosphatase
MLLKIEQWQGSSIRRAGMNTSNIYTPVVAGIAVHGSRFLAARRPPGVRFGGLWEFPGGKVESGETLDEALVREFVEELNIRPTRHKLWQERRKSYGDNFHVWLYFFIVTEFQGIPEPREGQTLAWLTPQEALEKQFLSADIEIVHSLGRLMGI